MKPRSSHHNQYTQLAQKFAEYCALKDHPPRLYRRMLKSNKKRLKSEHPTHNLRKPLQTIFRNPSAIVSIIESNPEVLQFLQGFQPELDHIIRTTPKSTNWLSERVPPTYWDDIRNQRNFFEWIAIQRGFRTHEDWYQLTYSDIVSLGGKRLINKYEGSFVKALQTIYPEKQWLPFLFHQVSRGYWDDINNQKRFLDWVATQRGLRSHEDWYQLTYDDIVSLGGSRLLNKYKNSVITALETIYPEKHWNPVLFHQVPRGYWDDLRNQRKFFEWVASQRGLRSQDDWYQLTYNDIVSLGGVGMLAKYKGSLAKALETVYSGIQTMEDWYTTVAWEITHRRGSSLIQKFGSVYKLLKHCYPEYPWDQKLFKLAGSATQFLLFKTIRGIFKQHNVDVFVDYFHQKMLYSESNRMMQLDIFVPQLNLAFEYQGEQHYEFHYLYGHPDEQQMKDAEKKAKCAEAGITLIEVPYWWDKNSGSLLATIHQKRPDIIAADQVPQRAKPIAERNKEKLIKDVSPVSGCMLPAPWDPSIQPVGWWMSEMYGGVRAVWNSGLNSFWLRNGATIKPPKPFADALSHLNSDIHWLDGVLWLGYGKQQDIAQKLAENSQDENLWKNIQYRVFDIPNSPYRLEERLAILKSLSPPADSPLKVVEQVLCQGTDHLMKTLADVEAKGGEGVILKLPKSSYAERMSSSMLKVQTPKGKARIKTINTSSATCELASGIVFDIPIAPVQSEMLRKEKSDIIVSFKQTEASWNGFTAPTNPSLLAVRKDLTWENVLEESTPYFLGTAKQKRNSKKCVGCKQTVNKTQYCVYLQSLYTPYARKPHTVMYEFCSKSECLNKAAAINNMSGRKLIPKMEAVYVPSSLPLSQEKLQACIGIKLLSARPL